MSFLSPRECSRSHRAKGSLELRCGLALCCSLLAVLLGAALLFPSPSEKPLDTRGWKLTDFLEHLNGCGLQLRVAPGRQNDGPYDELYLTENPDATWDSLSRKPKTTKHIHLWHGSVCVWPVHPCSDVEWQLAEWGLHGCRIGDFLLFGDAQILQRIQEACRQQSGL